MANTDPIIPAFTIQDRLRKAREIAGLSQEKLADAIDVSNRTISRYETPGSDPRTLVLKVWAMACGVDYEWLAGPDRPRGSARRKSSTRRTHPTHIRPAGRKAAA